METIFRVAKTEANEKIYCSECEEIIWQLDDMYFNLPGYAHLYLWCNSWDELIEQVSKFHRHYKDKILPLGLE